MNNYNTEKTKLSINLKNKKKQKKIKNEKNKKKRTKKTKRTKRTLTNEERKIAERANFEVKLTEIKLPKNFQSFDLTDLPFQTISEDYSFQNIIEEFLYLFCDGELDFVGDYLVLGCIIDNLIKMFKLKNKDIMKAFDDAEKNNPPKTYTVYRKIWEVIKSMKGTKEEEEEANSNNNNINEDEYKGYLGKELHTTNRLLNIRKLYLLYCEYDLTLLRYLKTGIDTIVNKIDVFKQVIGATCEGIELNDEGKFWQKCPKEDTVMTDEEENKEEQEKDWTYIEPGNPNNPNDPAHPEHPDHDFFIISEQMLGLDINNCEDTDYENY